MDIETLPPVADVATPEPTTAPETSEPSAPVDALTEALQRSYDELAGKEAEPKSRMPDGKFAKADQPKELEAPPKEAAAEAPKEPAKPVLAVPDRWTAEEKAEFAKLDPAEFAKLPSEQQSAVLAETRQAILRREADRDKHLHAKSQELSQQIKAIEPERKFYNEMRPVIDGIQADLVAHKAAGGQDVPMAAWIANAHKWHQVLANPELRTDAFRRLAEVYQVDLAQFGAPAPADQDTYQDPAITSLRQGYDREIGTLKQTISGLQSQLAAVTGHISTEARSRQEAAQASVSTAVAEFRDAKAPDGTPLHPHFDAVAEDMAAIIGAIRSKDPSLPHADVMSRAYKAAVAANDDLRAQDLAAEKERLAKEYKAEQAKAAEAARVSARLNPKSSPSPAGRHTYDRLDDAVAAAYDQLSGGR